MVFKWMQQDNVEIWHLFIVPDDSVGFRSGSARLGSSVAVAYYVISSGWMGMVYPGSQDKSVVRFSGMDVLEDMKLLLQTTVALRQG